MLLLADVWIFRFSESLQSPSFISFSLSERQNYSDLNVISVQNLQLQPENEISSRTYEILIKYLSVSTVWHLDDTGVIIFFIILCFHYIHILSSWWYSQSDPTKEWVCAHFLFCVLVSISTQNALIKVVNAQETLQGLYNKQLHKKAESILSDCSHPLHQQFQFLPSGTLHWLPLAKTNRFKHSFIPSAASS